MPGIAPDGARIEVIFRGENRPCDVRITLQNQQSSSGALDYTAAAALQPAINQGWHTGLHQQLGQQLFGLLLPGPVADLYRAALAASGRRGVRITLEIDEKLPALHRIPWERMLQPDGERWLPLCAAPNVYFSRTLRTGKPWPLPAPAGALNVLVVISSPFAEDSEFYVDVEKEKSAVRETFERFPGQIEATWLEGKVSLQQIVNYLNAGANFDILHYVGHGAWDETAQTGSLVLTEEQFDGTPGESLVPADTIVEKILSAANLPRLIFLGACESGQQSTHDAFLGVGPQLVKAGCPAVVCMQEKVENRIARQFAVDFYGQLLETGCVDLAVNRARVSLLENQYFQWAVPVLYMHLSDGILFNPRARFRPQVPLPYKSLASFERADSNLFKGRADLIAQIAARIRAAPITVLEGESGVGLTSLLEAGVAPLLAAGNEDERSRVLRLTDYADLAGDLRLQLEEDGRPVFLPLAGDAPLADVVQAASTGKFRRLIVALDQFEDALALPAGQQQALYQALDSALNAAGDRLRLVLAAHSDALTGQSLFRQWIGDRAGRWLEVLPLEPENAVKAIYEPLVETQSPVQINLKYVREEIVPDLTGLYGGKAAGEKAWIDPGQLQITCSWLYENASKPNVDAVDLYENSGGADGILVRYMKEELERLFRGPETDLARQILVAMAAPEMDPWVLPEHIQVLAAQDGQPPAPVPPANVLPVLNKLARAELLLRRYQDGKYAFAFPNHTVAEQAALLGGESTRLAYRAGDELERAWRLWLAQRDETQPGSTQSDAVLPARDQLRMLANNSAHVDAEPVKVLMLLRAAVLHREPAGVWLQKLANKETDLKLLQAMEGAHQPDESPKISGAARHISASLLGLADPDLPKKPTGAYGYGDVAWAAAQSNQSTSRQTAALALTALPEGVPEALVRLKLAVDAGLTGLPRLFRKAELLGAFAETIPEDPASGAVKAEIGRQGPGGRAAVHLWRSFRRFVTNRQWITWSALGSGIGAGLALGLERFVVGVLSNNPGISTGTIFFTLYSYFGFLLLFLTGFLMALTGPLLLRETEATSLPQRALFGTLGFGLANLLVVLINGGHVFRVPFTILFGFVAGLVITIPLALAGNLMRRKQRWVPWAAGAAAALAFAAIQVVFVLSPNFGAGISTAFSGGMMESYFSHWKWIQSIPGWNGLLSVIDAFLSGLALIFGALGGRNVADRWYLRWQEIVNRYGG